MLYWTRTLSRHSRLVALEEFTRFQHEAEDTALWFVLDELKMYIACDRVEDTRWCGKWECSFNNALIKVTLKVTVFLPPGKGPTEVKKS